MEFFHTHGGESQLQSMFRFARHSYLYIHGEQYPAEQHQDDLENYCPLELIHQDYLFDIGFGEFLNDTIEESPFSLSWRFCGEKLTSSERYHTSVYHDANCCKLKFLTLLFYYSGVPSLI